MLEIKYSQYHFIGNNTLSQFFWNKTTKINMPTKKSSLKNTKLRTKEEKWEYNYILYIAWNTCIDTSTKLLTKLLKYTFSTGQLNLHVLLRGNLEEEKKTRIFGCFSPRHHYFFLFHLKVPTFLTLAKWHLYLSLLDLTPICVIHNNKNKKPEQIRKIIKKNLNLQNHHQI